MSIQFMYTESIISLILTWEKWTYPVSRSHTLNALSLPPLTARSFLNPGHPMEDPQTSLDFIRFASLGPEVEA
jgi:hypothetical protein